MTLLLSDDDVREAITPGDLVDPLANMFLAEATCDLVLPPRLNLDSGETFLRIMPAMLPTEGVMGFKAFHGSGRSGVRYLVALYDLVGGEILAMVDAAYLTAARTGATSAVAVRHMAPEARSAAMLGSGLEAETNLAAVASSIGLHSVKVFSPRQERRESFALRLSTRLGLPITPCSTPEETVRGVDLVLVATNTGPSGSVAYQGRWAEPGQCVVSIGSTNPRLREIDEECLTLAGQVVVDAAVEQIAHESGDVISLCRTEASRTRWMEQTIRLSDVVKGPADPLPTDAFALFKSVGTAAQDVVGARVAYEAARRLGIGTDVSDVATPKFF